MIDRGEKYRNWKKVIAGVVTIVMVLAMGISGTLAYLSTSGPLLASRMGVVEGKSVMAHDDFYEVGNGTFNKDIYVENTGEKPVFIRVKLTEALTVGGNYSDTGRRRAAQIRGGIGL